MNTPKDPSCQPVLHPWWRQQGSNTIITVQDQTVCKISIVEWGEKNYIPVRNGMTLVFKFQNRFSREVAIGGKIGEENIWQEGPANISWTEMNYCWEVAKSYEEQFDGFYLTGDTVQPFRVENGGIRTVSGNLANTVLIWEAQREAEYKVLEQPEKYLKHGTVFYPYQTTTIFEAQIVLDTELLNELASAGHQLDRNHLYVDMGNYVTI